MSRAKAKKNKAQNLSENKSQQQNTQTHTTFPQESHINPKATHSIHKTGAQL